MDSFVGYIVNAGKDLEVEVPPGHILRISQLAIANPQDKVTLYASVEGNSFAVATLSGAGKQFQTATSLVFNDEQPPKFTAKGNGSIHLTGTLTMNMDDMSDDDDDDLVPRGGKGGDDDSMSDDEESFDDDDNLVDSEDLNSEDFDDVDAAKKATKAGSTSPKMQALPPAAAGDADSMSDDDSDMSGGMDLDDMTVEELLGMVPAEERENVKKQLESVPEDQKKTALAQLLMSQQDEEGDFDSDDMDSDDMSDEEDVPPPVAASPRGGRGGSPRGGAGTPGSAGRGGRGASSPPSGGRGNFGGGRGGSQSPAAGRGGGRGRGSPRGRGF